MIDYFNNKGLFHKIFQLSHEGIIVINENNDILIANSFCEKLFGFTSKTLINKNITTLLPTIFKTKKNVLGIKKNGIEFTLDIRLNSTVINEKNVTIIFLKDSTNRKKNLKKIEQTDNKLIESNRKFDTLINNLQGIVYRCKNNSDFTIEYISEGCLTITGYSPEDFLSGKINLSQLTLKEDLEQVRSITQNGVNKKKPYTLNFRIRDKTGNIKYLQELGRGIFDKKGNFEALEGFITDFTNQKKTEIQLRTSEAKMKALLKANPDMMFIQDRKGNYLDWYANNPESLYLPPEKFMGVNMKKVLPPNVYQKIKASHNKVIASGKMQLIEYSVKSEKGIIHFEARVVLMNDHSLLTIVRNITEKKATDAL